MNRLLFGWSPMTLPAGARLGPYEIVSPLGAGGMGEVYRARDAKLNRDVAIKVMPDFFATTSNGSHVSRAKPRPSRR